MTEMKSSAIILENRLSIPHDITHSVHMLPIYSTPRYTLKVENMHMYKYIKIQEYS